MSVTAPFRRRTSTLLLIDSVTGDAGKVCAKAIPKNDFHLSLLRSLFRRGIGPRVLCANVEAALKAGVHVRAIDKSQPMSA